VLAADAWPPLPPEELKVWFNRLPVAQMNGIVCAHAEPESARMVMSPPPGSLNNNGAVNGASLAALSDLACGLPISGSCRPGEYPATIELSIRYVRAATKLPLTAESRIIHRGGRHAWSSAEIRDAEGEVVCFASGTWALNGTRSGGGDGRRG
jgi:uncharacterized protein (TIGR00369 family)